MRKILSVVLSFVLTLSLCPIAFANEVEETDTADVEQQVEPVAESTSNDGDSLELSVDEKSVVEEDASTESTARAVSASSGTYEDLTYSVLSDGSVEITGYTGSAIDVVIPETIDGYPVSSIGESAFEDCTSLKTIQLPSSVKEIGYAAFRGCSSLETVGSAAAVESVGSFAFSSCTSLVSLDFSGALKSVGSGAFLGCRSLETVGSAAAVESVGSSAFFNCTSLVSFDFSSALKSIGASAFAGCSSLKSVGSVESVVSVGASAFSSCTSLVSLGFSSALKSIGHDSFYSCSSLKSVGSICSVESVDYRTFSYCSSLASLDFSSSLKSVGEYAFTGCVSLKSVGSLASVGSVGSYAFNGCSSLAELNFRSVESFGSDILLNCESDLVVLCVEGSDLDEYAKNEGFCVKYSSVEDFSWEIQGVFSYTGNAVTPVVSEKDGSEVHAEDVHYTVSYESNIDAGTAFAVIKGMGDYAGEVRISFTISPAVLKATYVDETVLAGQKPGYAVEITGFVNDESPKTAAGYIAPQVEGPKALEAGEYELIPSGGAADNYVFEYVSGILSYKCETVEAPEVAQGLVFNGLVQQAVSSHDGYVLSGDYRCEDAGTYRAVLTLNDGYAWKDGSREEKAVEWSIAKAELARVECAPVADQPQSIDPVEPDLELSLGDYALIEDIDYQVDYFNNTEMGTATAVVTGIGNFTGEMTVNFEITEPSIVFPYISVGYRGMSMGSAVNTVNGQMYYKEKTGSYDKTVWHKVDLERDGYFRFSGTPKYSVDFIIYDSSSSALFSGSFSNSDQRRTLYYGAPAGTYYIKFSLGSYSSNYFLYNIDAYEGVDCEKEPNDLFSTATPMRPNVEYLGFATSDLVYDEDYYSMEMKKELAYRLVVDHYEEVGKPSFYIYAPDRATCTLVTSKDLKYNATLDAYVYSFRCNVSGVHYVRVSVPNDKDSLIYGITLEAAKQKLTSSMISLSYSATSYTGYTKKPVPTVRVDGIKQASSGYTWTYWNAAKSRQVNPKLVGTYYVQVQSKGHANTTSTAWKKFVVNPAKTSIMSLSRLNNGFKVKWTKKTVQCSGYQVAYKQVGTSAWKTKAVTGYKTNVKSVTGLKDKKSYQVRVRTYKTVNGVKYYSAWTGVKTIKTK